MLAMIISIQLSATPLQRLESRVAGMSREELLALRPEEASELHHTAGRLARRNPARCSG